MVLLTCNTITCVLCTSQAIMRRLTQDLQQDWEISWLEILACIETHSDTHTLSFSLSLTHTQIQNTHTPIHPHTLVLTCKLKHQASAESLIYTHSHTHTHTHTHVYKHTLMLSSHVAIKLSLRLIIKNMDFDQDKRVSSLTEQRNCTYTAPSVSQFIAE